MPNGAWVLGDLFLKDYGHEGSIAKLWEMRWMFPCKLGVYPLHDGKFEDFETIFTSLISKDIHDPFSDEAHGGAPRTWLGDCPAIRRDPLGPDRLFSSILEWSKGEEGLDEKKVIGWGLSAGGYYAIRVAQTHANLLKSASGHGAGMHYYIVRE
ncbi:UPF0255 protein [Paraphaeosphaeria sporulosa]